MAGPEPSGPAVQRAETRELRLAVVLYGGVSLAIYMHGTTKELHRLVKASALEDLGADVEETPSERFYRELLRETAERNDGVRTRVVVDVIAGTSAGGINGVYLAKALAHNRSQESLRDLWLNRGDIKQLLRGPGWLPLVIKVPWLLATARKKPPLKGDDMSRWIYGALRDMDVGGGSDPADLQTLMPPGHLLELFVTTTDFYGYDRDLMIGDPKLIHDHSHRHVLAFRFGDGDDHFSKAFNAALAFSARATSCFPGAFPPVSLELFGSYLKDDGADLSSIEPFFRLYKLSHAEPGQTYFVDGGVLDNRPFGHAIRALKRKPAESEVDRRLLYLEPDPAQPGPRPPGKSPSPLPTILATISGIPKKEPILDEILDVSRHNERVRRIRDIIEMTFDPIAERVEKIVGGDFGRLADSSSPEDIGRWRDLINEEAQAAAGLAHATYLRSKVSGVVDRYARTICRLSDYPDDCNQAAFVRAVLRSWAEGRLFPQRGDRPVAVEDQVEFLRKFDLDYGARRLRFVIDGLSWWYQDAGKPGFPARAELNEGKKALYDAREVLRDAMDGRNIATDLTDEMLAVFAQEPIDKWVYEHGRGPEEYAREHGPELAQVEEELGKALEKALAGFSGSLFARVRAIAERWSPERRKDILVRYLGFPFWDILLYPIQAVSEAGERDAIEIVRMSPLDATLLDLPDPDKPKLAGMAVMHFGAFFKRDGRENDYLWGRLDGAERLIGLLLGDDHSEEERAKWCRTAFAAIADEEGEVLTNATELLDKARSF
jgi:patatin-related protein